MAVKGLEQTQSRLDQVKKFGGLVIVAILAAALVVGALVFTGVLSFLTVPQVRVLGFVVPSEWVVFIGAFTVALTLIVGYVYYAQLVLSTLEKAKELWMGLPDLLQSVVLALQTVALVAGLILLTDQYILTGEVLGYQQTTLIGAPIVVGLAILVVTVVVRNRGWSLMEWARTFYLSALLAGLIGALVGFAFAGVYIDNPPEAGLQRTLALVFTTPPGAFLVAWGALLYMLLRRRKTIQDSFVTGLLTRSGYAQMRQVETLSVSLVTGLVLAVVVALTVAERERPVWELVRRGDWDALRRPTLYSALAGLAVTLYIWAWPPGVVLVGILGDVSAVDIRQSLIPLLHSLGVPDSVTGHGEESAGIVHLNMTVDVVRVVSIAALGNESETQRVRSSRSCWCGRSSQSPRRSVGPRRIGSTSSSRISTSGVRPATAR